MDESDIGGSIISDPINPDHYKRYPVEVIEITENLDFLLGNVVKYVVRAPFKGHYKQDLDKALWYLKRAVTNANKEENDE